MIVTCVHVHVKPGKIQDFIDATTVNHLESVREPGNLRFDFVQQADDPCRFMIYEAYVSKEASLAHKSTPHYLKWRDTVGEWMAEPRKGVKYYFIAPTPQSL